MRSLDASKQKASRRPRLRVFGARSTVRPARLSIDVPAGSVLELWTFDQIEKAAEWESPSEAFFVRGIGWLVVRETRSPDEHSDIAAENDAAIDMWRESRNFVTAGF